MARLRKGMFVKGQETRRALMQAAQIVFEREGFMRAEIGQITEQAGKGKGTFYLYFDSKQQLLAAMVDAFAEEVRGPDMLASPTHAPEQIRAVLGAIWSTYKRHAATFRAMADAAVSHPEFDQKYQDIRSHARRDFAAMMRARQAAGACRHVDADLAASVLERMVNACLYEWLALGQDDLADETEEARALDTLVTIARAAMELGPE